MRHTILNSRPLLAVCMVCTVGLTACSNSGGSNVTRTLQNVNVVDESNLNDIMLTVADPNEAVAYFQRTLADHPRRIDLLRGLGKSQIRAKRATEAAVTWQKVSKHAEATDEDRVDLADALIRSGDWKAADEILDRVPPTYETFKRYRLEAMVADSNKEWKKADSFYETAIGLTTRPASVMNNWGYSKLTRGEFSEAERLFGDAIRQDTALFTAKNNLILARGAQKNYTLPVIPMTQTERAQLLHTLALSAIKQGDVETGKGLLREAVETHPQHFEAAVRGLRALENSATN